jgi:hypothetical protein
MPAPNGCAVPLCLIGATRFLPSENTENAVLRSSLAVGAVLIGHGAMIRAPRTRTVMTRSAHRYDGRRGNVI